MDLTLPNTQTSLAAIATLLGVDPTGKSQQQFLAECAAAEFPTAATLEQRQALTDLRLYVLRRNFSLLLRGMVMAGLPCPIGLEDEFLQSLTEE